MRTLGAMKQITYAERAMLMGDAAANLLIEFGAALARHATADTVELSAIAPDGHETAIILLLGPGTVLLVESSDSLMQEPDNAAAESFLQDRISMLEAIPTAYPVDAILNSPPNEYYEGLDL